MDFERRSYPLSEVEIRSGDDGKISFRGLAATYGSWSKDLGGFVEQVTPQAFTRSITDGADVPFLVNHDKNLFLGRTGTGTVRLHSDDRGLWVEAEDLPDTQAARDLKALGKEVRFMSFGFRVPKGGDDWNWKSSPAERSLKDVDLRDVSVLTGATPAYNETTAEVRALVEEHQTELRRQYSTAERVALAKKGQAIPVKNDKGEIVDGRYPIADTEDLGNAVSAYGRASDKGEVQAWIKKRAAALGATDQIPDDWRSLDEASEALRAALDDLEERAGAVLSAQSKQRVSDAMQAMRDAHTHLETLMTEAGETPQHGTENDVDGVIEDQASLDARLGRRSREVALLELRHADVSIRSVREAERTPAKT